jgi:hypothetical protein
MSDGIYDKNSRPARDDDAGVSSIETMSLNLNVNST